MKKFFLSFPLVVALALTIVLGAAAAEGYTLFGDARSSRPATRPRTRPRRRQPVQRVGGVDFAVPAGLT